MMNAECRIEDPFLHSFCILHHHSALHTMLFTGIDHPAMSCQDAKALADWYCRHLGMKVIGQNDETPPSFVLGWGDRCDDPRGLLELMPIKHPGGPKPTDVPRFCQGL